MGPTWVLSAPDGPHVGHMNLAIRVAAIEEAPNHCITEALRRSWYKIAPPGAVFTHWFRITNMLVGSCYFCKLNNMCATIFNRPQFIYIEVINSHILLKHTCIATLRITFFFTKLTKHFTTNQIFFGIIWEWCKKSFYGHKREIALFENCIFYKLNRYIWVAIDCFNSALCDITNYFIVIFMDLSEAFDTVHHKIPLCKFQHYDHKGAVYNLFRSD